MTFRPLPLLILTWGLNACSLDPVFAPAPTPRYPATTAPPVQATRPQPPPTPPSPARPMPETETSPRPARPKPPSPAVVALMQQAERDRARGDLERAASKLERGLRIQPRNAGLWYQLAKIRLQQEQPGLAEELAKKSLSLAAGQTDLIRRNWALIARARHQRGDVSGAREAKRRAAALH